MISQTLSALQIRPIESSDNEDIKRFIELAPEGGKISVQTRVKVSNLLKGYELLYPGNFGLIARLPGVPFPVGMVYGWPHLATFNNDSPRTLILIHSLGVHPQYLRRGIASLLVLELVNWAKKGYGEDTQLYAFIQSGNAASLGTFSRSGFISTGQQLSGFLVKTLPLRKSQIDFRIREAQSEDYEIIAAGLNEFYMGYDLYQPQTPRSLNEWLTPQSIAGISHSLAKYYVATAANGEVLGGIGISGYGSLLFERKILDAPLLLKLANNFLNIVPKDGVVKNQTVKYLWYRQGEEEAMQALTTWVRQEYYMNVDNLIFSFDTKSPQKALVKASPLRPVMHQNLLIYSSGEVLSPPTRLLV